MITKQERKLAKKAYKMCDNCILASNTTVISW